MSVNTETAMSKNDDLLINSLLEENAYLKAELTKARELLGELDEAWNSHDGRKRFGELMKMVERLANQSAPAAKAEK